MSDIVERLRERAVWTLYAIEGEAADEIERLQKERIEEVAEFNAGYDCAQRGGSIHDEPDQTPHDQWCCGFAWGAFERLRAEADGLLKENIEYSKTVERLREETEKTVEYLHGEIEQQKWVIASQELEIENYKTMYVDWGEALNFAAAALVEGCDKSKDEALRHIAKLDGCVQKIEQPLNERQSDD